MAIVRVEVVGATGRMGQAVLDAVTDVEDPRVSCHC